jgi:hypothetical protein
MKIPRAQARGIFVFLLVAGLLAGVPAANYAVPKIIKRFTPKVVATNLDQAPTQAQQYARDLDSALGLRQLSPEIRARLASVTNRTQIYRDGCHGHQDQPIPVQSCVFGDKIATKAIWLIGDSHAAQWFVPLSHLAKSHNYQLVVRTMSSCPVLRGIPTLDDPKTNYWQCKAHNSWLLEQIRTQKPSFVVVSGYAGIQAKNLKASTAGLSSLANLGSEVLVLADTPKPKGSAPDCLAAHESDIRVCAASPTTNSASLIREKLQKVSLENGFTWVDPTSWLCVKDSCPAVIAKRLIYADNTHLSTEAQHYMVGHIEQAFGNLLVR